MNLPIPALVSLPLLLLAACGGSRSAEDQAVAGTAMPDPELEATFTEDGLHVRRFDTNLDGEPDLFKYFQVLDDDGEPIADPSGLLRSELANSRIVRKESDLNYDGAIDDVREYDRHQDLDVHRIDSNFDGLLDTIDVYSDGAIGRREADTNGDGVADLIRYYRGGSLQRTEEDTDFDANHTPDVYHYFTAEGALERIGRNFNNDLIIDEWQRLRVQFSAPRAPSGEDVPPSNVPEGSGP